MSAAAVVLAAGKGTRMKSAVPKVLHPICGLPMIAHVVNNLREAGVERILVVVGQEDRRSKASWDQKWSMSFKQSSWELAMRCCRRKPSARLQRPRTGNPR